MQHFNNILKYFFIFILFILWWSFLVEPNTIIVKHYKIKNEALKNTKIVFASDFHLKKNENKKLKRIVRLINKQNADIVLLGGDFVNGQTEVSTLHQKAIAQGLSQIKSKHGIYAVLGNHDWWYDGSAVKNALAQCGIKVLMNENHSIKINNKKIYIAGVEDLSTREPDVKKALINTTKPVIFLTHSPDTFVDIPDSVDLILAGHTHGGQIIIPFWGPFFVPSDYGNKYAQGLISEDNKKMIVSRGIGTSSIHARFNCLPEIIVIDFI